MPTVYEYFRTYAHDHPGHFMVAADHTFDCSCYDCLAFLITTSAPAIVDAGPDVDTSVLAEPMAQNDAAQLARLRLLFDRIY